MAAARPARVFCWPDDLWRLAVGSSQRGAIGPATGTPTPTTTGIYGKDWVPPLDQSLSALLQDLDQRGLLETTIVLAMGEFGRTPHINPDNGRDHWPHCWSLVIGGGGIQGGQVVGASDEKGAYVEDEMVTMGDLFATIYKAFGIDWEKEYMTRIGRPIKIANSISDKTGSPIDQLI